MNYKLACGAASFIAAFEGGLIESGKVVPHTVDLGTKKVTETGEDFFTINPKDNVPALLLDDGTLLNENAATLQWIADNAPKSSLAPAYGTSARYQLMNQLSFLIELHVVVHVLFASIEFYDLADKPSTRIETHTNRACSLPDEPVDFTADETGNTQLKKGSL